MPKFVIYFLALFGAVFTFAGCLIFYGQVLRGRKETEAEVLAVDVESFQTTGENGETFTAYRAKYEVSYQAEGRTFRRPLTGNTSSSTRGEAVLKSRNNPVGTHHPIYYLPRQPDQFLLDPLTRRFGFSLIFLTIGLTISAMVILLHFLNKPLDW